MVCAAAMLFSLVGCAGGASSDPVDAPEPADNTANSQEAETTEITETIENGEHILSLSKDPGEYKICVYWPAPDTYFEENIQPGYQQIEKEYGVTIEYKIGTEWTQDIENQIVEAMAAQGYDLFLIYGADTSGANALYRELRDAGCQVINYGGVVDDPQEAAATICGDVYQYSYAATISMIDALGGEGQIINVLENLGDVNTLARQKGVEDAVAEYDGVTICQTIGDINTEDEGYEKVSNALAANPEANGIIATGGTASRGMVNALKDYYASNSGADHLFAVGTDPSDEVMDGIRDGTIDIGVAQNGFGQGYLGSLALLFLAEGWEVNDWGVHIVTGYVFIGTDNIDTFSQDIEALTKKISDEFKTTYFSK